MVGRRLYSWGLGESGVSVRKGGDHLLALKQGCGYTDATSQNNLQKKAILPWRRPSTKKPKRRR